MPDKCAQHNKMAVGNCNWCGRALCQNCIAKYEGKKIYCSKCMSELSPIILKREADKRFEADREKRMAERVPLDIDSIMER